MLPDSQEEVITIIEEKHFVITNKTSADRSYNREVAQVNVNP